MAATNLQPVEQQQMGYHKDQTRSQMFNQPNTQPFSDLS